MHQVQLKVNGIIFEIYTWNKDIFLTISLLYSIQISKRFKLHAVKKHWCWSIRYMFPNLNSHIQPCIDLEIWNPSISEWWVCCSLCAHINWLNFWFSCGLVLSVWYIYISYLNQFCCMHLARKGDLCQVQNFPYNIIDDYYTLHLLFRVT